jgi:hypothetical protein
MKISPALQSAFKLLGRALWHFLYFPIWWYTVGFLRCLKRLRLFLADRSESLGVWVWLKNIFTPMYGRRDFASRLISFVMRLIQVLFRGLILFFWLAVVLTIAFIWLILPPLVVFNLLKQL